MAKDFFEPPPTTYHKCANDKCRKKHKVSHWDNKKAEREGWFMQFNGDHWCPKHVPDWVEAWRLKKQSNKG